MLKTQLSKGFQKEYPYLGIWNDEIIVLFTSPGIGMCLREPEKPQKVGEYSKSWSEDEFDYYTGKITLANE